MAVTSCVTPETRTKAEEVGMFAVLQKPGGLEELYSALKKGLLVE